MSAANCVTHHYACDCREAKIKALVKAVRDALYTNSELGKAIAAFDGEYET